MSILFPKLLGHSLPGHSLPDRRIIWIMAGFFCLCLANGALAQMLPSGQTPLSRASPDQPLFKCTQETMGQVACQAGAKCKCLYEAFGNAMMGLPPGYRWDCNPKYGSCLVDIPAETSRHEGNPKRTWSPPSPSLPLPPSFGTTP